MAEKVKLALVGCGGISGNHVNGYKDLDERGVRDFEVAACCDVNAASANLRADEIAAFQGRRPEVFADVDALAKSGVAEAADICVPHCFHHSAALPLIESGMHVLLEKPLGITVKASRRIIDAARRKGVVLATAENIRRGLSARACRWAVSEAKMIGEVRLGVVQSIAYGQFNLSDPKFMWRSLKLLTGGGMIMDSGAHLTDMAIHMFGEPDEVSCLMQTLDPRELVAPVVGPARMDVEDMWHAVLGFRNGTSIAWSYSRVLPGAKSVNGVYYGSEGSIEDLGFKFHPFQGGGRITLADGTVREKEWIEAEYMASLSADEKDRLFPGGATDGFAVEVADFTRAVGRGDKVEMDGEAGLMAKALSMSCYESATARRPVKFAEVLDGRIDAYQRPIDEYWKI